MSEEGFNPFEPGFAQSPYDHYARLRDRQPVHHSVLGPWFLFRHDDVREIIQNPHLSVEIRNATPTARFDLFEEVLGPEAMAARGERGSRAMLNVDPPDHTRLRRLVSKAFTPRTVEELRPRARAIVDEYLDRVARVGSMDVIADLAFPLPVTVISEMLGMPQEDRDMLRDWSHRLAGTLDPVLSPDEIRAAVEASDEMSAYLRRVIGQKRAAPADDLLSALIHAEDEGDVLSEHELLDNVTLLYIAGHETTVNLVGNGLMALLAHPDRLAEWRDDPSLDANGVEELLRYDSPVQFTRRITLEPITVGGHDIDAGSFVLTCLGSANRDPEFWGETADTLDLRRPNARQHVSFGSGVHHCLGAALARMEAQEAIGALIRRFPRLELADAPEWNGRVVLRGLDRLPVSLTG